MRLARDEQRTCFFLFFRFLNLFGELGTSRYYVCKREELGTSWYCVYESVELGTSKRNDSGFVSSLMCISSGRAGVVYVKVMSSGRARGNGVSLCEGKELGTS